MEKRYKEALEYLYNNFQMFSNIGGEAYKPGLDMSLRLSKLLGNPHEKFKSIHVGGTNGKGSTAHMIASVLQTQGYKVGLYTSPHLVDFRERMKINGKMIPKSNVVSFIDGWKALNSELKPSFFEITMTMAFDWFAKEEVEYAVVEVGMGGRLDSTNIITPELSVITNISLDHTQFLGNTLTKIAKEKAGIIKPGVPVVIGETRKETEEVFRKKASETCSSIFFADTREVKSSDCHRQSHFPCSSEFPGGEYQKKNIKIVLTVVDLLRKTGMDLSDQTIWKGIEKVVENTGLIGRWTILGQSPEIIADGGHNQAGLNYNFRQLERLMRKKGTGCLRIIIGFMADKAIDEIIRIMPEEGIYYATNVPVARALPANVLMKKMHDQGLNARAYPSVRAAIEAAKKETSKQDLIFIGGSFGIVGEALREFKIRLDKETL